MKKFVRFLVLGFFLSSLFLMSGCQQRRVSTIVMQQATSKEQVTSLLLNQSNKSGWYRSGGSGPFLANMGNVDGAMAEYSSHTSTNTQVSGIDEGDIIKVDGQYIYTLTSYGLTITQVQSGNMTIVYQEAFNHYVPQELYILDDYLILIGGIYEQWNYLGSTDTDSIQPMLAIYRYFGYEKTNVKIYDMQDRSALELVKEVTVSGYYQTSRLLQDQFYLFANFYPNLYPQTNDEYGMLPWIQEGEDQKQEFAAQDIYYYPDIISSYYLVLGQISLADITQATTTKAYLGLSGEIYVSYEHVFVATYDNTYRYFDILGVYNYHYNTFTRISKIRLSDLMWQASSRVSGNIKDRYSLDEYQGYLRIATTTSDWSNRKQVLHSNVYVLNPSLQVVGKIENIAPDEMIYAVRFHQEEGTLVTFRQIDPLFKLNLSDPTNPTISLGLKEDGVSYYLHPIAGTDLVLGLGYDTQENQWGGVTFNGVKLSLYDVSGEEAVNISTVIFEGMWTYSEAIYNPKAIFYDAENGLFGFAMETWVPQGSYGSRLQAQGFYVFSYLDRDLSDYVTLTHFEGAIVYQNWQDYYGLYFNYIHRGARIGNYLYTISEQQIQSYLVSDFSHYQTLIIGQFD